MPETKKAQAKPKVDSKEKVQAKPKVAKPKIDYKKKFEESQKQILNLNKKIKEHIFENNKNIDAFQSKAKGFQSKAQEEINKVKEELRQKAEADEIEIKKYGAQKLLENILIPLNNIDVAIKAGENQQDAGVQAYVQGFKMLMGQLFNELESYGIKTIEPKVGDEYDPESHQAFSMIDGGKKNTIQMVKTKGYKLHDRVIKPAIVVVYK